MTETIEDACCAPSTPLIRVEDAQRIAGLAKALSDPVRLRIYQHIASADCSTVCACHLPEVFGVAQPTLSHHLKKLVEAGLVNREMRGRWAHFSVRPDGLNALRGFLDACAAPPRTVDPALPRLA